MKVTLKVRIFKIAPENILFLALYKIFSKKLINFPITITG